MQVSHCGPTCEEVRPLESLCRPHQITCCAYTFIQIFKKCPALSRGTSVWNRSPKLMTRSILLIHALIAFMLTIRKRPQGPRASVRPEPRPPGGHMLANRRRGTGLLKCVGKTPHLVSSSCLGDTGSAWPVLHC